jgi:hypothetical protein
VGSSIAVGSGVASSVAMASGGVTTSSLVLMEKISLKIAGRSRRLCGIIRIGRRNWSGKSRNRHAFNNIFGEGCPVATALVRIAEAGHVADEHTVRGAKSARGALMIFRFSPACRELKQELNHVSKA